MEAPRETHSPRLERRGSCAGGDRVTKAARGEYRQEKGEERVVTIEIFRPVSLPRPPITPETDPEERSRGEGGRRDGISQ